VDPRAGLDAVAKKKKSNQWPCQELKIGRPAQSPNVLSNYNLH